MAYTIEVQEDAAIIVLNSDDNNQLFLPKTQDDVLPDHVILAAAISLKLQNEDFVEDLLENFGISDNLITPLTLN
jgi:hypothetical protein